MASSRAAASQCSYRKVIKAVSSAGVHFTASVFAFAILGRVTVGVTVLDFDRDFDFAMSRGVGGWEDGRKERWRFTMESTKHVREGSHQVTFARDCDRNSDY